MSSLAAFGGVSRQFRQSAVSLELIGHINSFFESIAGTRVVLRLKIEETTTNTFDQNYNRFNDAPSSGMYGNQSSSYLKLCELQVQARFLSQLENMWGKWDSGEVIRLVDVSGIGWSKETMLSASSIGTASIAISKSSASQIEGVSVDSTK
ncbi:hypothetical protein K438DRAFT_1753700 [Mycena galopus ATCC 62051]|nr:hypothetical protein K438DRAFT_1753700 [Mycena galopus ATCC 62051]